MITLDSIINDLLDIEKEPPQRKSWMGRRTRKDVDKELRDETEFTKAMVIKIGEETKSFIRSPFYKDLVEPFVQFTVKGGIQKLLTEGETMTETELKSKIASIRTVLRLVASLRLKIINGDSQKGMK